MGKYARLASSDSEGNRTVIEVLDGAPADRVHPDLASEFISVPDATVPGSVKNGQAWTHPDPVEPAAPTPAYRRQISPVEFKMLFTSAERIAIRMARSYDGDDTAQRQAALVIDDWWGIVDDPRLTAVDLNLPQTQEGLDFLVSAEILTPARRADIGLGMPG
ncbi:MAG: hypothetical protein R3184_01910 [Aurantimonas coralicida]|nr:hypothetical protein [Aurantimonas coralicida]